MRTLLPFNGSCSPRNKAKAHSSPTAVTAIAREVVLREGLAMAEGFDIRHDQTFGVELYELEVPEAAEARPEVTRRLPQLSPRLRAMVKWGVGLISAEVGLLVAVVALHDTVALVGVAGLLALLALGACLHGLSDKLVAGEKGQVRVLSLIVG